MSKKILTCTEPAHPDAHVSIKDGGDGVLVEEVHDEGQQDGGAPGVQRVPQEPAELCVCLAHRLHCAYTPRKTEQYVTRKKSYKNKILAVPKIIHAIK